MRALVGGIPRAFKYHKTPEGWRYGEVCRAKLARLGPLPKDAMPILREFGRVSIELERLGQRRDAIASTKRPRRSVLRQLGSEQRKLRVQMLLLEKRLEELGDRNGHKKPSSGAELLERWRREGSA